MTWRLILDGPCDAFMNMAIDEAISEFVRKGDSPPTLRFYQWERPSITIGYFQRLKAEVEVDYCSINGYPVVRRPTGGRAVLHNDELTYSLSSQMRPPFSDGLLQSYNAIARAFLDGLRNLGLDARISSRRQNGRLLRNPSCFQSVSYGEITIDGEKLIGSAQKRWGDGVLQQGSILLSLDTSEICRVLRIPEDRHMDTSGIGFIRKHLPDITVDEIIDSLKMAFERTFGIQFVSGGLTLEEAGLAETLRLEKYLSGDWNFMR